MIIGIQVGNVRYCGDIKYVVGLAFTDFYTERFQADLQIAYFSLLENFLLFLKLWPGVDI